MKKRIFFGISLCSSLAMAMTVCLFICLYPDVFYADGNGWVLPVLLAMVALVIGAAFALTYSIVKPISKIDPNAPLSKKVYEELIPLLSQMAEQNAKISSQIRSLSDQKLELDTITENMSEGLVIFNEKGDVLSANESAKAIFGMEKTDCTYLELCGDRDYLRVVESALKGVTKTGQMTSGEKVYALSATSVKTNFNAYAAALFIMDVTQREQSDRLRREFSANVSHELKTPLTSIMGYAEIIGNGIAKPEDVPKFTKQIRDEAARLLALIEDIIRLSRLDEADLKAEFKPVDLAELCRTVADQLADKAKAAGVTINCVVKDSIIEGFQPVLYEMIYNLCDNAIAYNKKGGSVTLSANHRLLIVKDTGIGIAPENQERVFERFYRVDKSHSKETGGTGLGLSIVKHGAMLHNGEITLESRLGEGTEISVYFH